MKKGFYIGRFQPFHKGHFRVINKLAKKVDYLIIGVGSSNRYHTIDNPFTLKERVDMINESLKIKNYTLKPIPDIDDYPTWGDHVLEITGKFDVAFTGNKLVKQPLERANVKVKILRPQSYMSATTIRDMMANDQDWEKYVPKEAVKIIKKVHGVERVKGLNKFYRNPIPTVDVVIELDDQIVLVKREQRPYGWAIPGGHVDYGETVEDAAIREVKEETSLDVELVKLLGVYSDPKRDPRGHRISTVFIAKGKGSPKAGSDAKGVGLFTKDNLPELVFDHKKILEDYFNEKDTA